MRKENKIRLLFVVSQMAAGGSERVVLDLARSLDPEKYDIFVAAFMGGVLEDPFKRICKDIFLIEKRKGFDISAMFRLSTIIRKCDIDIVNAHHFMPCFYSFLGTRILNRKRLIYTEHSVPEVDGIACAKYGKVFYYMLFRMNAVIGVSREITEKFKMHYPIHAGKFHQILNAVDIDKFMVKENREEVRNRWGLTKDHFVIGTVANFRKVKNHACLVRAAARIKDSYPNLRLIFVGTSFPGDSENSELQVVELIRNLDMQERIFFAGYQDNIPAMLSAFDAFCLPSFSEGLPVSVLEAMAAGIPVIGSHVRGIKEVVKDFETGLLFLSNDDLDLSHKIKVLLSDSGCRQVLANRAFDYVRKEHSRRSWTNKTTDIFLADL